MEAAGIGAAEPTEGLRVGSNISNTRAWIPPPSEGSDPISHPKLRLLEIRQNVLDGKFFTLYGQIFDRL
jgi:hypothetical protein